MAEIIGVVAAAEQFAEVVFKTVKLVKSVADQIQDGPGQIQQNIQRLESLASLAKEIQNTKSLQTEDIDLLQKISFDCHESIQKKTWRAISGLKQQTNISKLFDDLDHEYNSLNTHIHLRILAITGDIQTGYNSIDTKLNATANSSPDSSKCLQALFITDPATNRAKLINSKEELVQGICDWIAQKKEFVEWKDSDGGLLWISGGPGLEQSRLASACISYFYYVYRKDKDVFQVETAEDDEKRNLRYPLFDYASRQWTEHFKHSGQQGVKILAKYPQFFSDKSELLRLWMELANIIRYADTRKKPPRAKELYYAKPLSGQAELAANYGLTVLMKTVLKKQGRRRYFKRLFTKPPRSTGSTHLQLAAANGHIPIIEILLKNKVLIDSQDSLGHTALHCAAAFGHLSLVTILVENGACIDCETAEGDTALDVAVERGHYKMAEYLLAKGANVNGGTNTATTTSPLRKAVYWNRPELAKLLLEWKASDRLGDAFQSHLTATLGVFVEYWAEKYSAAPSQFRDKVDFGETTALHIVCRRGDLPAIRTLLDPKWSLDVNRQDQNGNTALHWAAMEGRVQAVRLLLMKPGVDPNVLNHWGELEYIDPGVQ
ncbi:ankyrin repeat domain-containing protein 52 [Trichoderma harzianum]|uniref:Ankyrin repeat domain-containing protein 52 n=1 Tax=Trichoderma harzianum TaxID=5544 RepID=A0A0F9Y5M9_TRIHA|nr:ankyrin repeat domain-containing protein 52 [Trichoderma harzianum]